VKTEPAGLDVADLKDALERHWGLRDVRLEYLPVGFGGYHWRAVDAGGTHRFVTADDLFAGFQAGDDAETAFRALERAYGTAAALSERGLEFVLAPLPDLEGAVVRRLSDRYTLSTAVFVEGEPGSWGDYESPGERRTIARLLGRLHAATDDVDLDLPRAEDFTLPRRDDLATALREVDRPWDSGPFGEPARRLLAGAADAIERRLADYDRLVTSVRARSDAWVVTHGEPHRGNVVRDSDGGVHLVDWDTTLLAPRERDLWWVLDDELTGWDEYRAAAGEVTLRADAIDLYRRGWDLADIAIFAAQFRAPHERTEDTLVAFEGLSGYLGGL
jgi:spectinomycin phosphotransferase